jgi:hypothetical protein
MAFSTKLSENFGRVFENSPYTVADQIVKIQHVSRGNNVVFGRAIKEGAYDNLIYIGKVLETSPQRSYLGADAWLDITFPHVIYVTGTRGSGKSFDLGVIVEGISQLSRESAVQNQVSPLTSIVIDTQSQFWTLRYPPREDVPANRSQLQELRRWNLQANAVANAQVFVPPGSTKFLGDEIEIRIRPSDVTQEEWCSLIGQEVYSPQGHVLAATLAHFQGSNFDLSEMCRHIADDQNWPNIPESSRNAVLYKLSDYDRTGLFGKDGIQIYDLLKPATCNILMLRDLRNEDKALITAILARQLFTVMGEHHNRKKIAEFFATDEALPELPGRVWLVIDEAHVVAPKDGPSPARQALIEYVKRGRDAGLSLVLATQQPSAVDDRILSQVNVSFNHRLTFQSDINSAVDRIPTKTITNLKLSGTTLTDFGDMIRVLDSGQCFIGDHSTSRAVLVQIRPRVTAHGGYSPL